MRRGTPRPTPPSRVRPLHLPTPGLTTPGLPLRESQRTPTPRSRRRRPSGPLRQLVSGLLCVVGAALLLQGLMILATRLNTLPLVSQAVANLIRGLSLLAAGLLQVVALLAVAALALLALLLLVGGLARLVRALITLLGTGGAPRSMVRSAGKRAALR
ncbi:MAG: hypothetical protein FJ083_14330 [Cyanobacteria bacterium K_Offshore_surface_m2_239]|nr:hypothetical protein [Cyanobacteria bacterium K_Offshore_surface_m2_239]